VIDGQADLYVKITTSLVMALPYQHCGAFQTHEALLNTVFSPSEVRGFVQES